jgi:hypothetical protein
MDERDALMGTLTPEAGLDATVPFHRHEDPVVG